MYDLHLTFLTFQLYKNNNNKKWTKLFCILFYKYKLN